MEDVLTDLPPPSRFFEEDLSNFFPKSPPLPPPFLHLNPNPNPNPNLLIIFISPPSLSLLHSLPSKTLIGTLTLPQTPPLPPKSSNIFSLNLPQTSAILLPLHSIPDETSRSVAQTLLTNLRADRVLIMDSIKAENCRSGLSDGSLCFKLETSAERAGEDRVVRDWESLPPGSVMGGVGAAVIGECQIRGRRAAMCATWGRGVEERLRDLMRGLGFVFDGNGIGIGVGDDDDGIRVCGGFYSDMYV